jgi:hypothetical protein
MNMFIRISEFAKELFADHASQIMQGIMTACSSRLSDIAAYMPGTAKRPVTNGSNAFCRR